MAQARPSFRVQGVDVPAFVYGTAWKEDATRALVAQALQAGFRGIDTANQRKHYHEAAVGAALRPAFAGGLRRDELFLQTKFTHLGGQDHRLPYDPKAPVAEQVRQSFQRSLLHLGVDTLDSYLLHGPSVPLGLGQDDWDAWRAMEELQRAGKTRLIGISNVSADQLDDLCDEAKVPPAIVQNRCFTRPHSDHAVRDLCTQLGIVYQGFSLLTGNSRMMGSRDVQLLAARLDATVPQVVFRYCMARGIVVLTGTTDAAHMAEDLAAADVELSPTDLERLDALAA